MPCTSCVDAGERTALDDLGGDQCEEALDLIEPRAAGRGAVNAQLAGVLSISRRIGVAHHSDFGNTGLSGRGAHAPVRRAIGWELAGLSSSEAIRENWASNQRIFNMSRFVPIDRDTAYLLPPSVSSL